MSRPRTETDMEDVVAQRRGDDLTEREQDFLAWRAANHTEEHLHRGEN